MSMLPYPTIMLTLFTISYQGSHHFFDTVQANRESSNGLQTDTPQTRSTTSATLTGFIKQKSQ